jgi:hypothetical protein
LGYALKALELENIEGEAQNQLSLAHGRAEPCLTTAGRAELIQVRLLRQSHPCTEASQQRDDFRLESVPRAVTLEGSVVLIDRAVIQ